MFIQTDSRCLYLKLRLVFIHQHAVKPSGYGLGHLKQEWLKLRSLTFVWKSFWKQRTHLIQPTPSSPTEISHC